MPESIFAFLNYVIIDQIGSEKNQFCDINHNI